MRAASTRLWPLRTRGWFRCNHANIDSAAGGWVGVEVKLGGDQHIDSASKNLLTLAERIDPEVVGPPSALIVVTLGGYGYRRPDGVWVIPISTLGP